MGFLKNVSDVGAEGFNTGTNENRAKGAGLSLFDYLHNLWNNTKSKRGIYLMYEKILTPSHLDENGDIVYTMNS